MPQGSLVERWMRQQRVPAAVIAAPEKKNTVVSDTPLERYRRMQEQLEECDDPALEEVLLIRLSRLEKQLKPSELKKVRA